MLAQRFLLGLLLSLIALAAAAFDRPFPQNAQRGTMSPDTYPNIVIDGKLRRLAAGSIVRNQDNLIQMPATIANGNYAVKYTEDNQSGEIVKIWILTDVEAQRFPKK